jgi:hypothetical protein
MATATAMPRLTVDHLTILENVSVISKNALLILSLWAKKLFRRRSTHGAAAIHYVQVSDKYV